MNVSLTGRQIELTEPIKDYINASLLSMEKYNLDIISASVVVSKQERNRGVSLEYTINIAGKNTIIIKQRDDDLYAAADLATEAVVDPPPAPLPEPDAQPVAVPAPPPVVAGPAAPQLVRSPAAEPVTEGFTLRFESDIALARLVATGQVGFFAMDDDGAQRMSVSGNRISFWSAPVPNRYHEMDGNTVPKAVRDALARTGRSAEVRHWAVTLPSRLTGELQALMQEHSGGALVIAKDGSLRREST